MAVTLNFGRLHDVYVSDVNSGMGDRGRRSHLDCCSNRQASAEVKPAGTGWRILAVASALNVAWEMAQMFAYAGMSRVSFRSLGMCSAAAIGDGVFALVLYWAGVVISGDPKWVFRMTLGRMSVIVAVGFVAAVIMEKTALSGSLWQYADSMPRIPVIGVGLWPVLQLMTLPLATFCIVRYLQPEMER